MFGEGRRKALSSQPASHLTIHPSIHSFTIHRSNRSVDKFIANANAFISTTSLGLLLSLPSTTYVLLKPKGSFCPHLQDPSPAFHVSECFLLQVSFAYLPVNMFFGSFYKSMPILFSILLLFFSLSWSLKASVFGCLSLYTHFLIILTFIFKFNSDTCIQLSAQPLPVYVAYTLTVALSFW